MKIFKDFFHAFCSGKKNVNRLLLILFFILSACSLHAQQNQIDSLKKELSQARDDTNKLIILNALIEGISENSAWLPYNTQMGSLSQALMKSTNAKVQKVAKKYFASCYNNIGYISEDQGNIPMALDCYYKSLKLHEEAGDTNEIATELNNIGIIKDRQGDKQAALELYIQSLKIQQKTEDKNGMALSLSNIGTIYDNSGRLDSALNYYMQSLKINEGTGDKEKLGITLSNIGGIYDKKNDAARALEYYTKSLNIQEKIGDKVGIAVSQINFGMLYRKQKNYPIAEKYFEHAMQIAREIDNTETMRGAAKWLSEIYALQGKYKEAYAMQVLFKQLADKISNTETKKQAVKKQMQYEYEKKEAIIKSEHDKKEAIAKNEIEKQRQIKLITLIASVILIVLLAFGFYNFYSRRKESFKKTVEQVNNKALRSQMNPHFIFNSLNSIQDFINSNDSKNANTYIVKFSKLVRLILENSRRQEILLSEDLKALELYMQLESLRLHFGFDYEIKIDSLIDAENTLVPPLIIQPFVENAIWHGLQHKKGKGRIMIVIQKKDNELECIVEDNGVGRIAAIAAKEAGTAEKRKSLGMEITKERIHLYNNIKNTKAFFEITDLLNADNVISGMRVLLHLPFEEAI